MASTLGATVFFNLKYYLEIGPSCAGNIKFRLAENIVDICKHFENVYFATIFPLYSFQISVFYRNIKFNLVFQKFRYCNIIVLF